MGSKRESLNERIRETISSLSDADLNHMKHASPLNYTPFALEVLEEELRRRARLKAVQDDLQAAGDPGPTLREVPVCIINTDCFIEVWSEKNFEGSYLIIEGPAQYQGIVSGDVEWGDCISSLRVGPSAFVLVYAEADFKGTMLSFGPGQQVPDLDELNFNDEIDSFKVVNSVKIFEEFRS